MAADNSWKYTDDFLIELQKKNSETFKLFVQRFFKREKSAIVLAEVRKKSPSTAAELYQIFAKYVRPSGEININNILLGRIGRQLNFMEDLWKLPKIPRPSRMLDFGCNDGVLTVCLNKHFRPLVLDGCDLVPIPEVFQKTEWNYIKLNGTGIENLNESIGEKYQLVSALNVLHHTQNPKEYLSFLISKLARGDTTSYIFLKEHDTTNGTINDCIIREWHRMYEVLYKEEYSMGDISFVPYKVLAEWIEELGGEVIYYEAKKGSDFLEIYHLLAKFGLSK
jgi:hypothetical protein